MSVASSLLAAFRTRLGDIVERSYRTELWHSATFVGMRHLFTLEAPADADVAAFTRCIAEDDIAVPGGFVADLLVNRCATEPRCLDISVLTIEA